MIPIKNNTKYTVLKTNPELQTLASEIKRIADCLHRCRVVLSKVVAEGRTRPAAYPGTFVYCFDAFICIIRWTVDLLDATKEL